MPTVDQYSNPKPSRTTPMPTEKDTNVRHCSVCKKQWLFEVYGDNCPTCQGIGYIGYLTKEEAPAVDPLKITLPQWAQDVANSVDWHAKYTKLVETNAFMIKHNQEHIFKLNVIITFLKEWHEERDDE